MSEGARFLGSVAVVTGGSKGIGRGIALRLADDGADVAITYLRDRAAAEGVVEELRARGRRACARKAFFGDPDSSAPADVMAWATEELGPVDLLVSNAGSGVERTLLDTKRSHWNWTMETHAAAFLQLVQAGPDLRAVTAVSSLGASRVLPSCYGALAAAKAALESLVRYFAIELAPRVRVNAVTPGLVETETVQRFSIYPEMRAHVEQVTPCHRLVTPEEVGALVSFLLSDEVPMLTGQVLVLDGGYSTLM